MKGSNGVNRRSGARASSDAPPSRGSTPTKARDVPPATAEEHRAATKIQALYRGRSARARAARAEVSAALAAKREEIRASPLRRIASARAEDQMRRVEAACARAGVKVTPPKATPPRPARRDDRADSDSDSDSESNDDDDHSPPVAAAVTPSADADDVSRADTPQSGPRVADVIPQPRPRAPPSALLSRAVEAAADAVAAAEAAADASFDDAEERLSPQRNDARTALSISAAPSLTASPAPAPPRPAGFVHARDDALASILGYLDEVEHESDAAGTAPAGIGARTAASNVPGRHFSVRASVAAVRASYGGPSAKTATASTTAALSASSTNASLRASQSESPLRALKRLALMDASDADAAWEAAGHVAPAAGALAAATSVYEGVRARMESLKSDLARRDATVAKLEAELRVAYDRASANTAAQLAEQRAANDAATQRHLDLADRLLRDKEALAEKVAELTQRLADADARRAADEEQLRATFAAELKRQRTKWEESRAKWEEEKTAEVKELTIRGLEPEIQRLVQKHRDEVRDLRDEHRDDLRRQNAEMASRHEAHVRAERERVARERDDELEKERDAASARLRAQAERYESQLRDAREKASAEGGSLAERYEAGRRDERERYEAILERLNEESAAREERARRLASDAAATADARRESELAALQARLDRENAAWKAKITAKAQEALRKRELEIIARAEKQRDDEIEALAERLRGEAVGKLAEARDAEARAAAARADRAERAASAAERAVVAAEDKAAALERELAGVREAALREGVVGGAFEDRLRALAAAAAAAETRAAAAEADCARAVERRDAEVSALEARVRSAIGKKDETIAGLNAQLEELRKLLGEEEEGCAR